MKLLSKSLMVFLTPVLLFIPQFEPAPGWHKSGSKAKSYDMGLDKGAGMEGKNCASIKSIDKKINGFGTLMQSFMPDKYLGKKIRMSGYMKSEDVKDWAGFWLRIDAKDVKKSLSFDNMQDRPIKGTTDWQKYEIILDVPEGSGKILFGALLSGTGQIWFDKLEFEIAEDTDMTTGKSKIPLQPQTEPVNLDFEK